MRAHDFVLMVCKALVLGKMGHCCVEALMVVAASNCQAWLVCSGFKTVYHDTKSLNTYSGTSSSSSDEITNGLEGFLGGGAASDFDDVDDDVDPIDCKCNGQGLSNILLDFTHDYAGW